MRVVGLLLISALMIVPNADGAAVRPQLQGGDALGRRRRASLSSVGGVVASYYADTPSGGTIVLLADRLLRRRRRRHGAGRPGPGEPRTARAERHDHEHGAECGHPAVAHGDHVDYVHDGHRHAAHEGHYDEHGLHARAPGTTTGTATGATASHGTTADRRQDRAP